MSYEARKCITKYVYMYKYDHTFSYILLVIALWKAVIIYLCNYSLPHKISAAN